MGDISFVLNYGLIEMELVRRLIIPDDTTIANAAGHSGNLTENLEITTLLGLEGG